MSIRDEEFIYDSGLQRVGNFILPWITAMEVVIIIAYLLRNNVLFLALGVGDLYKKINDQKGKLFTEDQVSVSMYSKYMYIYL